MPTLQRADGPVEIPERLPAVALRDLVYFPYMVLPLLIGRPRSAAALRAADRGDGLLVLVAQRNAEVGEPEPEDLFEVGTVVRILEVSPVEGETARVVFEGVGRVKVLRFEETEEGLAAAIELFAGGGESDSSPDPEPELAALVRRVRRIFDEYVHLHDRLPDGLIGTLAEVADRGRLAHSMAGHLIASASEKQSLLESGSWTEYFARIEELALREVEVLRIEEDLDRRVHDHTENERKQAYLRERLRVIQQELGGEGAEVDELESTMRESELPEHARERVERELARLRRINPVSPESAVIRSYVDWILGLPWSHRTTDNLDVEHARQVLDEAHFGLDEVKERILDHIAVLSLVDELRGPVLCLVGPPGVGKTSLGRSIAEALGREFVRVSLGGVRDEAEIRGHRRTYVGALPGRILQGMRRSGSINPVLLLDEVDKLSADVHGDPAAALLEVLDPEQNRGFMDHYLELDYDLSGVLFLATANTLGGIPDPLRDRMEVIRIPGYLETEKRIIARRFLWPKQARAHGLSPEDVSLGEGTIRSVIEQYTREAGVRELDRCLSKIARKTARRVVDRGDDHESNRKDRLQIGPEEVRTLLGPPPHLRQGRDSDRDRVGIANGLAWTAAGGEVLDVEVAVVPGTGKIHLTGTLGEVMRESAVAAVTYARSRAERFGLDRQFQESVDLHIHIPEGATPKDGPSAGVTIATALISALTDVPTRSDTALTGEITLRGRVLGVGGIKEKCVAALREGVRRVVLPETNGHDLETLPDEVRAGVEFTLVSSMDTVLEEAFVRTPSAQPDAPLPRPTLEPATDPSIQISQ